MSGYIGAQPVPQATQHREAFTATASQTSFATAGYTPQFVDVYLNGVKLAAADYTATNGSDIVLTTGAALDDILEYVAYTPFEVADQTFTGTTTVDALVATGITLDNTNPNITSSDADGFLVITGGTSGALGANMRLHGPTHTSFANDILFRTTTTAQLRYDDSAATWDFQGNDIVTSGGIYLGGTAAANKLDDIESGTWSPNGSWSVSNCTYSKVGSSVTITLALTSSGTTSTISNLPFATASSTFVGVGIYTDNVNFINGTTAPTMVLANSSIYFRSVGDNVAFSTMPMKVGSVVHASITYTTA